MNTLTYQDLNDFYREETKGYNFGTSVGGNTDKGKANMAPNGSNTIHPNFSIHSCFLSKMYFKF